MILSTVILQNVCYAMCFCLAKALKFFVSRRQGSAVLNLREWILPPMTNKHDIQNFKLVRTEAVTLHTITKISGLIEF